MANDFDLVILGVGMAGVNAANKCASAGWKVAVVDALPYGGTCALRGCDPKKMLRRAAEVIDAARLMRGKGIEDTDLTINWPDLLAFKRTFTERMPGRIEAGFERHNIKMFHGPARFVDETTVEVGDDRLAARFIFIATGAVPRPLGFPGAEHLVKSDDFLELAKLPRRLLFVGGGFVSFEFAHIAARAGSEVHIIDRRARPLKTFDPDLVDKLVERSKAAGIDVQTRASVLSVTSLDDAFEVTAEVDGLTKTWTVDLVVHGAGRIPALDQLDLAAAGVEASPAGVVVNEYLQSVSNPAVYAGGDAAASPGIPLTPVAVFEGKVAASNMLKGNRVTPDYRGVPSAVFTIPELTRVGLLESEAREQGLDVRVKFTDTSGWYSNLRVGETCAATKIIVDNQTGEVVGAHLLGPEYAEITNFFGLGMRLGLKASDLKKLVSVYPTVGSDLGSML